MTDYTVEDTIYQMFTTRAFATGIPTVLAGTPVVSAYENDSATQITAGITLGVSHDSVVGMNLLTIVATAANGYESGKDYNMVITTGTVGGVSVVGEVVGSFSLGRSAAAVDLANGTDGLGAIKAETAAILVDTGTTLDGKIDTIDTNVDSILVDTAEIGVAGAGLTDLGGMSTGMMAEVESEANDALVAQRLDHLVAVADADDPVDGSIIASMVSTTADWSTFVEGTDSLQAIRDRGDAAWTTGAGGSDRLLMVDTTIATLASQTSFTLTAGSADDDAYNNCTIVIEDASTSTQKAVGIISDYTGSTLTVTLLNDPGIFTMATTDKVYILAENALKATAINRQLDVTATGAAGIDWGNIENPTTAVDLSGTDIQLVDTTTTNTDMRGTDSAALASVCTEARLAELDAGNIPTDIANLNDIAAEDVWAVDATTQQTQGTFGQAIGDPVADTTTIYQAVATDAAGDNVSVDVAGVKAETALIVGDTGELQTDWANGGRLDLILDATSTQASVDIIDGNVDDIETAVAALNDISTAEVNAEVLDVMNVDTITLPGQTAPPLAPTHRQAIAWLYKALRNRKTQTATQWSLLADDESTVDAKATVSDDGTTAIKQEIVTGP